MVDEEKYRDLAEDGKSPYDVYRAMRADKVGWIPSVRLLREIFQLSLEEAKEVAIVADGIARSLDEHEERLARGIEALANGVRESKSKD